MAPKKLYSLAHTWMVLFILAHLHSAHGEELWSGGLDKPLSDFHTPMLVDALEDHIIVEGCHRELRKHPGEQRVYAAVRTCTEYRVPAVQTRKTDMVKQKHTSPEAMLSQATEMEDPKEAIAAPLWQVVAILTILSGLMLRLFPAINVLNRL